MSKSEYLIDFCDKYWAQEEGTSSIGVAVDCLLSVYKVNTIWFMSATRISPHHQIVIPNLIRVDGVGLPLLHAWRVKSYTKLFWQMIL